MNIGIVGSEAAKFTNSTKLKARAAIKFLLSPGDVVISGGCHLGGIDKWAIEIAQELGLATIEFTPEKLTWDPGYKQRNIKIAEYSNKVICITVKVLPEGFKEGGWEKFCYHCNSATHIKSGGCWTMKYAAKLGKPTQLIVIGD